MTNEQIPLWRLHLLRAYPLWRAGAMTPNVQESAVACLMGVVLTPLVLPWRHIAHHYFRKTAERWRSRRTRSCPPSVLALKGILP